MKLSRLQTEENRIASAITEGTERERAVVLDHLHSFALPTPKSGEIYVWIGRKFGVRRTSFPSTISGEDADLNLKNGNLTKYGKKRLNLD
jgi:hypothetical protein